MKNKLTNSNIPTTWIFNRDNGYTWNPVRGCANAKCFLHPKNTGKCWAAKQCNRWAGPWATHEANMYYGKRSENIFQKDWELTFSKHYEGLLNFNPTWFESQYRKEFPKRRSCIFVCSQTDIAYIPQEWLEKILTKIVENNEKREKAGLPFHIFQFLTKNPEFVYKSNEFKKSGFPPNCWLGFTAWDQFSFDRNLEETNHAMYARNTIYAYLEPLQGQIKMNLNGLALDWVILGGGPEPVNPDWVRNIRDQCQEAEISFYFKQWGEYIPTEICNDAGYKYSVGKRLNKINGIWYYKLNKIESGKWINILEAYPNKNRKWEQFPKIGG